MTIFERVYKAAETLQDEWGEHEVPSPSTVMYCRRELWYSGRGTPRTDRVPPRSIKRMESGKRIEDFWKHVYARAGFTVLELGGGSRVPIGAGMSGEFDAILLDTETGERYLLELKDLSAWGYIAVLEHGVRAAEPNYYYQMQCYMGALGLRKGLLHVGQADPGAVYWVWSKIKKRDGRPPDFIIEEVAFDVSEFNAALRRAAEIRTSLALDTLPTREYDPHTATFPCPYCAWRTQCLQDG